MTHHRAAHASRPSRASEAGFALLEVVVSAAVLAIVAVAVLAGIDGAQSSTGREKSRSVAANLAEQDQERMRSMQVDSLADYTADRPIPVDGSSYRVVSQGQWVKDDTGGTISCQNNSTQADYLQISSTVTNTSVGVRTKPVVIQSLVAPSVAFSSTRGSLAVQVNDRNGVGVPGLAVNISGPSADSAATNATGCAVFQFIPKGNYNITLNRVGWVDHFGTTVSVGNQDVTVGKLNVRTMDYDRAATAVATIGTYKPCISTPSALCTTAAGFLLPSTAFRVSANNSGEPGMQRVFAPTPATTAVTTLSLTDLFPFKNAYGVFTGGCEEANPVVYHPDYFVTFTGSIKTDPGGTHPVTVRQPPLNFRVQNNSGAPISGAAVVMTLRTNVAECVEAPYVMTTTTNPYAASIGWPSHSALVFDPGLPFGRYNMCLEYLSQVSPARWRYYRTTTSATSYDNTAELGRATTTTLPPSTGDWSSSQSSRTCT